MASYKVSLLVWIGMSESQAHVSLFQSSWFNNWPWIHYDQANDKAFGFVYIKVSKVGNFKVCASKGEDMFVTRGYTNWKDARG